MRIGLLISGGLGEVILKDINKGHELTFVMTDKNSLGIKKLCSELNINIFVGNPRNGRCTDFISNVEIDVLVSVNYLFLIERDLINLPKKCAFNVHGSLLPKYRGRTPHVWAIINNEKFTGITAHLINEGCDTGPILEQKNLKIEIGDTGATLLDKYAKEYPQLVNSVLKKIEGDQLQPKPQNNRLATYFGKRTPDDGLIDWEWSKERIYNWIRAQAPPYPGAFTFFNGAKIVIKSSKFSDLGFDYDIANGTLLSLNPLTVKTCNGALEIQLLQPKYMELMGLNDRFGN